MTLERVGRRDVEETDEVRRWRECEDRFQPDEIDAARRGPRDGRVRVAIDQHHESGPQRGHDHLFDPLRQIGGIEQEGFERIRIGLPPHVANPGRSKPRGHERSADHPMPSVAQPLLEEARMGRAARPIDAFEHDQVARFAVGAGSRHRELQSIRHPRGTRTHATASPGAARALRECADASNGRTASLARLSRELDGSRASSSTTATSHGFAAGAEAAAANSR